MIQTREKIDSPVDFLQAHPELIADITPGQSEVVLAADKDIIIDTKVTAAIGRYGLTQKYTHPVLGNLYVQGSTYGIRIGNVIVDVDWFPSPSHDNKVSEELGLRPGLDVLRFAHSTEDEIPRNMYRGHFGRGEYPLSIGPLRFRHDRGGVHAPGVFLSPALITGVMIHLGARKRYPKSSTRKLDSTTSAVSKISEDLAVNDLYKEDTKTILSKLSYFYLDRIAHLPRPNNEPELKGYSNIVELLSNNLGVLIPRINVLQAHYPSLEDSDTAHHLDF